MSVTPTKVSAAAQAHAASGSRGPGQDDAGAAEDFASVLAAMGESTGSSVRARGRLSVHLGTNGTVVASGTGKGVGGSDLAAARTERAREAADRNADRVGHAARRAAERSSRRNDEAAQHRAEAADRARRRVAHDLEAAAQAGPNPTAVGAAVGATASTRASLATAGSEASDTPTGAGRATARQSPVAAGAQPSEASADGQAAGQPSASAAGGQALAQTGAVASKQVEGASLGDEPALTPQSATATATATDAGSDTATVPTAPGSGPRGAVAGEPPTAQNAPQNGTAQTGTPAAGTATTGTAAAGTVQNAAVAAENTQVTSTPAASNQATSNQATSNQATSTQATSTQATAAATSASASPVTDAPSAEAPGKAQTAGGAAARAATTPRSAGELTGGPGGTTGPVSTRQPAGTAPGSESGAESADEGSAGTGSHGATKDTVATNLAPAAPGSATPATTGTSAVTPLATATVDTTQRREVIDQVMKHLVTSKLLREGVQRSVLHLAPSNLGDVQIAVEVAARSVRLDVLAGHDAIGAFRDGLDELRTQLADTGLTLGDVNLRDQSDAAPGRNGARSDFPWSGRPGDGAFPGRRSPRHATGQDGRHGGAEPTGLPVATISPARRGLDVRV